MAVHETGRIDELEGNKAKLDTVKRENKNLAEEIKDLLDQLGEGRPQHT